MQAFEQLRPVAPGIGHAHGVNGADIGFFPPETTKRPEMTAGDNGSAKEQAIGCMANEETLER